MTVLIAGAGLAGARTAETLRAAGYAGRIVLAGDELHAPYERPALSKELLSGAKDAAQLELRPATWWDDNGIELWLGVRVESVDPARRVAQVAGERVEWDALVLATGARARRLDPRVRHLRTLDDALALRGVLAPGRRIAVVGAGFVGMELASTAAALGADVVVVDTAEAPLLRQLGSEVGGLLAARARAHGVDLRLGVGVAHVDARSVELAEGTTLRVDAVVAGIGAEPVNGLVGEGEIETDACGRTAVPDVYACGDVASWWRTSLGRHRRFEHWTSAAGQARAVARAIVGEPEPYDEVPYFWSDQFGLRLQYVGNGETWERVELEGDETSFVVRYLHREGAPTAALAANRPREIGALRRALAA